MLRNISQGSRSRSIIGIHIPSITLRESKIGDMKTWQERLRMVMREKGLTQKGVADLVGVSQSTLAAWLADRNKPGVAEFEKLAAAINEDVVWLIWGVETSRRSLVGRVAAIASVLPDDELQKIVPVLETMEKAVTTKQ